MWSNCNVQTLIGRSRGPKTAAKPKEGRKVCVRERVRYGSSKHYTGSQVALVIAAKCIDAFVNKSLTLHDRSSQCH